MGYDTGGGADEFLRKGFHAKTLRCRDAKISCSKARSVQQLTRVFASLRLCVKKYIRNVTGFFMHKRVCLVVTLFITAISYSQEDTSAATDPSAAFFHEGEKVTDPAKTLLTLKNRKKVSLKSFLTSEAMNYANHVLSDLDEDGTKELIVSNFTGGAHCCDEIFIFRNTAPGRYQQAVKLFAGHTLVTAAKEFIYTFYEPFGYFFSCYACGYVDSTDEGPIEIRTITLKYNKGKMEILPGDPDLKSIIRDNLGKLGEQPYEPLDKEILQDDGLRKEFAMNLAVYYYAFGKNLPQTRALFNSYYKYPDAATVWTEFAKQLRYIRTHNDF